MSNTENQNEATDRTDEDSIDNLELTNSESNSESTDSGSTNSGSNLGSNIESNTEIVCDDPVDPIEENPLVQQERINYEVVFFARYNNGRPSVDEITNFFNNYGVVHHVNCPEGRNNAFIFMSTLSTTAEHRRTRTTINQIRNDMTAETQFHITVASSNRPIQRRQSNQYQSNQSNQYQSNQSNQYQQNHYQQNQHPSNHSNQHNSNRGSYQPLWRNNYNRTPRQIHNYDNNGPRHYNNGYVNNNQYNNLNQYNNSKQYNNNDNNSNDQRGNGVRRWNNDFGRNAPNQNTNNYNTRRGRYQVDPNVSSDRTNNQRPISEPAQVRDTSDGIRRNTWRQVQRA